MNKLYYLLFFLLSFTLSAQLKEIRDLKIIEKRFDSILVVYQKKAKDSLSYLKKKERNDIMVLEESKIYERKKIKERLQLKKIKAKELEIDNLKLPNKFDKCNMNVDFQMPNLLSKTKYKPTISKNKEESKSGDNKSISSSVIFQVTYDGYIRNVNAIGENADFNTELELTLYKLERWTPRCLNGFTKTEKYRLPVTMNFN
ncbi:MULTISPECIES: hypothetical protein [Chryseobacterium]|uniref:TonB C-terminal domain-containing protein n=1 Tax=Chryseobacterium taihuense TaxID=1141221 RepID=A0A4U8WF91_9FLAO|nr:MULTISPECIES: hypothetical protein [Chryseobacterium]QQV02383.1 hypothetical protein I6I61_15145 [Chryseobacterium sp. FDAARGOS 1104]VFB04366.1 Uncharacterised protein [Chryseobacterium taihuense]